MEQMKTNFYNFTQNLLLNPTGTTLDRAQVFQKMTILDSLVHCKVELADATYKIWIQAFPWNVWIILFISSFVTALVLLRYLSPLNLVEIILEQQVSSKSKLALIFVAMAFFVQNRLENTLTSACCCCSS